MAEPAALYMGWDLSTTQLKGIVIQGDLNVVHEAKVDFDIDFGLKYGVEKGVLTNADEGEIYSPPQMWLEALDLVLERLKDQGLDFARVRGISGAGMQHGTVFWSSDAENLLHGLKGDESLIHQLQTAFSHPYSPNWQDASTQDQCDEFDAALGNPERLAQVTGSKAHHRFSGPQIMRFKQKYPERYNNTARISLVSSFLCSLFLGRVAEIDIGDVCGMNLRDIQSGQWSETLLELCVGKKEEEGGGGVEELKKKLGPVPEDGGGSRGKISKYFVERYGFNSNCDITPFTGDNPATILSLPLRASDAIVSLGTSTTFLMSTPEYKPDPSYHIMNHPTTAGLYMFMLCYKNGSLARERVRDDLNSEAGNTKKQDWHLFNDLALATPALGQSTDDPNSPMKLGLFFPRPEIVPNLPSGTWTFLYNPSVSESNQSQESTTLRQITPTPSQSPKPPVTNTHTWHHPHDTVRATLESQFLSCRLRAAPLLQPQEQDRNQGQDPLPPQPRRIYIVGGGAVNPAIAQICGEVLGGAEGVYRLDIGGNACALGAAYKAVWAIERNENEKFEEFLEKRWKEESFIEKVDIGYRPGVFELYGEAVKGFKLMEDRIVAEEMRDGKGKVSSTDVLGSALTRERTGLMGG